MKRMNLLLGVVLAVTLVACSKDDETPQKLNPQDVNLIYIASMANMAEIVLGQLASDSSDTPAIQAFGQKMVTEHTMVQAEVQEFASQMNITLPTGLDTEHEAQRQELLELKGNSFDSLYIHSQVMDHERAIIEYETAYDQGNNVAIKSFILETLPHLQEHWQEAQALAQGY